MSFAASFNVPSPSPHFTTAATHQSFAHSAHFPYSDRGNARGPPAPVTTSTHSYQHWSASSSPVSASSSPATASSWPTPPPALPSSHITLPPPPHHPRLPPIRPPSDYFSLFTRSPPAYHHPNLDKMSMSSVMTPQPGELPKIMGSMTSKEWVVPPRPKPGRKPATDTPPTKRKAQNRAAQRAFRERRAARVGELEEQLDQQKEDNDKKEQEYKDTIRDLEMELQSYKSRYEVLEGMLERERQDRVKAETDLESLRRNSSSRQNNYQSHSHSHSQSNTPPQLPSIASQLNSAHTSPVGASAPDFDSCGSCGVDGRCACAESIIQTVEPAGCGKCGPTTNCECLEEVVKTAMPDLKRAPSPSLASAEKRQRANPPEFAHEIDFTSFFKKPQTTQPQSQPQPQPLPSMTAGPPKDPCGFCQEGGYCFCADNSTRPVETTTVPPPPYSQQTTPPPSEDDVVPPMPIEINSDGAVKLRPRQQAMPPPPAPAARSCGPNGPGTCAQCVADPISGLFCRALSASLQRKGQSSGGCCGGAGRDGGCCKTGQAPKLAAPKPGLGLSLSCAEAYQTLSSHRNFDKATDDIGSWLPKLRAVPRMGETLPSPTASRLPIEVEAASIMSVLKDFDIRFGRGL